MVVPVTNRIVHVVFAPTGPLAAYVNPELAFAQARTMTGVDVKGVELHGDPDDMSMSRMLRIVFTPAAPIAAYYASDEAAANTFEGASITLCELRFDLPDSLRDDLDNDYLEDDLTPLVDD